MSSLAEEHIHQQQEPMARDLLINRSLPVPGIQCTVLGHAKGLFVHPLCIHPTLMQSTQR